MTEEIKRQTAFKCAISYLNKGVFVKKTGWESSYIMTEYGDFSRVNIIAVVVAKDESSIRLDDGTGNIIARVFDKTKLIKDILIGEPVLIIGRPREYNEEIYLTIEIIKRIKDKSWLEYRKKELQLIKKTRSVTDMTSLEIKKDAQVIESENTLSSKEKIISLIKQLDAADGANIDDVISFSKIKNAEEIIRDLILRGDIFELRPGKLKVM